MRSTVLANDASTSWNCMPDVSSYSRPPCTCGVRYSKISDAVCGFLAYFCAVLRFSDPTYAPSLCLEIHNYTATRKRYHISLIWQVFDQRRRRRQNWAPPWTRNRVKLLLSTKSSRNSGLGSEWNRHFPEFHSVILGVPREVCLKFRQIGITGKFRSIRPFLLGPIASPSLEIEFNMADPQASKHNTSPLSDKRLKYLPATVLQWNSLKEL